MFSDQSKKQELVDICKRIRCFFFGHKWEFEEKVLGVVPSHLQGIPIAVKPGSVVVFTSETIIMQSARWCKCCGERGFLLSDHLSALDSAWKAGFFHSSGIAREKEGKEVDVVH